MTEHFHCDMHSGTVALLSEHSRAIADLYEKHDDVKTMLAEIKLCTATMQLEMKQGFKEANDSITKLTCEIAQSRVERANTIEHYEKVVQEVQEKLRELDKFKWFRDRLNRWHDNLPTIIFSIVMAFIGFLALLHWLDLGKFFRKGM